MIDSERLDQALWIEQGFACASNILDPWFFPKKQLDTSLKEFKFKYQIKNTEDTCLYDENNLEIILNDLLGFNEDEFIFFKEYLKKKSFA